MSKFGEFISDLLVFFGWYDEEQVAETDVRPAQSQQPVTKPPEQVLQFLGVDCQGTLFSDRLEDNFQVDRAKEIQKIAEDLGLRVVVWTGGEKYGSAWCEYEAELRAAGFDWPMAYKFDYYGKTIAAVVDDDEEQKFHNSYKIKPEKYYQVGRDLD